MILITWQPGQLGNCLMLWSHFIAYGIENKQIIMNSRFSNYSKYFEEVDHDFLFLYPKKEKLNFLRPLNDKIFKTIPYFLKICTLLNLKIVTNISLENIYQTKFDLEDSRNLGLLKNHFTLCNGWQFRAKTLVKEYRANIISFFKPKENILKKVEGRMMELRTNNDLIVGIHIRRGDFKYFLNGRFFYEDNVYRNSMLRFSKLKKDQNVLFLICTNDDIELQNFGTCNVLVNNGNEIEDLITLSQCDYLIGPPSTFNIWASFYGEVPTYHIEDSEFEFELNDFRILYDLDIKF